MITYTYQPGPPGRLTKNPGNTTLIETTEAIGVAYALVEDLFHSTAMARLHCALLRSRIATSQPFRIDDAELWALLCEALGMDVQEVLRDAPR